MSHHPRPRHARAVRAAPTHARARECCDADQVPEQLNWDYGEPTGLCKETAADSGVFTREWTKATIRMDCNTWTPTLTMKPPPVVEEA